ncbi:hypothetical protein LIER_18154 [Lithospermum erythrorhizon]|uniref:Uncharacterized protein n=1 Tax=Lithospermum erythrorhizon TaxID=34254 RepID=A0AAV3QFR2_LITER
MNPRDDFRAGETKGQVQEKTSQMIDKASNAAQSAKESTQQDYLDRTPHNNPCPTQQSHGPKVYSATDIEQALHTLGFNSPDIDWYMDTGTTSHMTSDRGALSLF